MSSLVRSMFKTEAALVLAGTVGLAVSHVFGQTRDDPTLFVPPSPSASTSAIPPSPSDSPSATVGAASPTIASQVRASATNSPPFGYSRARPIQPVQRPTPASAPQTASKARPGTLESGSKEQNPSKVQQANATVEQPGWPSKSKAAGQLPRKGDVVPAGHFNSIHDPNIDPSLAPPPDGIAHPPLWNRQNAIPGAGMTFPTDRGIPPAIRGSHLGLLPGETATERSMRLMSSVAELERQLENLGQRNDELNALVRQRDDQLLLAIREIKSTRKDVSGARDELERLREQVKSLQEKVLAAERDNTALLQTMAPLLYQLLNADSSSSDKSGE